MWRGWNPIEPRNCESLWMSTGCGDIVLKESAERKPRFYGSGHVQAHRAVLEWRVVLVSCIGWRWLHFHFSVFFITNVFPVFQLAIAAKFTTHFWLGWSLIIKQIAHRDHLPIIKILSALIEEKVDCWVEGGNNQKREEKMPCSWWQNIECFIEYARDHVITNAHRCSP